MSYAKRQKRLPSALLATLHGEGKVVSWISELTQQPEDVVVSRLREEYENQGINVMRALAKAGLEPYIWSSGLKRFYEQTDAFLYELAIWNCNRIKRGMRKWIAGYLGSRAQRPLNILSVGDGLGFDSAYFAQLGHNVTYFEVPGYSEAFARKLFAECDGSITVVTNQNEIPLNKYDAVICLDVLEHVLDPHAFVETVAGYLCHGGELIVNASFYMIHPSNPTHLKSNRKYSSDLSLYEKHNLRLIYGKLNWNPLVFEKTEDTLTRHRRGAIKLLGIRLAGLYLALGRFSALPFWWVDSYRHKHRRWFCR